MGGVYDIDKFDCMLHKCDDCPMIEGIRKVWDSSDIELASERISFQRWDSDGSRASFITHLESSQSFLDNLFQDILNLTSHHFIADSQKNYIIHCKNELAEDTAIVLQDFAKNYSFIIQRSVRAYYYNNSQATFHPFALYYKDPSDDTQTQL